MNKLDRNTLRNALNDDGKRIPNSSWDLTDALEPLDPDDPFTSLFDLNTFVAEWIGDAPSRPFSDIEKELNGQYCREVEAIKKLIFNDAPKLSGEIPNEINAVMARLKEGESRISRAMAAWDRYVSPFVIRDGRVYVIRQPNYLMHPAIIRSTTIVDFANAVVVHCAALRDRIVGLDRSLRRRDGAIALLVVLLLATVIYAFVT